MPFLNHGDVDFLSNLEHFLKAFIEEAFRHTWPGHFTFCLKSHGFEEKDSLRLRLLIWASNGHCSRPKPSTPPSPTNLPKLPQVWLPCALDYPSLNIIRTPSRGFPGSDDSRHRRLKELCL